MIRVLYLFLIKFVYPKIIKYSACFKCYVLYFDDESQAEDFCEEQGLQLLERSDGAMYLNWGTSSIDVVGTFGSLDLAIRSNWARSRFRTLFTTFLFR